MKKRELTACFILEPILIKIKSATIYANNITYRSEALCLLNLLPGYSTYIYKCNE